MTEQLSPQYLDASIEFAIKKAAEHEALASRLRTHWGDRRETPYERFMQASIRVHRMRARTERRAARLFKELTIG